MFSGTMDHVCFPPDKDFSCDVEDGIHILEVVGFVVTSVLSVLLYAGMCSALLILLI